MSHTCQFSTLVSHCSFLQCAHIRNCDFVDFYRETGSTGSESQAKTLKSLIRNFSSGLPTSPMLGRKVSCHQTSSGNADRLNNVDQMLLLSVIKMDLNPYWSNVEFSSTVLLSCTRSSVELKSTCYFI